MSSLMLSFVTNDNVVLRYSDTGNGDRWKWDKDPLILLITTIVAIHDLSQHPKFHYPFPICLTSRQSGFHFDRGPNMFKLHGFTGCSTVWQRNVIALSAKWRVITPDLRGHGESDKPKHGYHVSRLAMDLRELIVHLLRDCNKSPSDIRFKALGGSLGCSILWCYAELFTTAPFTHMIFVDQSPLQNSDLDGWDERFCNRGMNNAISLEELQVTLRRTPERAYKNTIAACLAYRSHPLPTDNVSMYTAQSDESFFLARALKGDPIWYGKLMADHTSLDWRDSIRATFGDRENETKVLVIASTRSGCFPAEGPMTVVDLVNENHDTTHAKGVVIDWGGHWCYWENPEKFNELVLAFLDE